MWFGVWPDDADDPGLIFHPGRDADEAPAVSSLVAALTRSNPRQAQEEQHSRYGVLLPMPMTPMLDYDDYKDMSNFSIYEEGDNMEGNSVPCSLSTPGFDSLGLVAVYAVVSVLGTLGNGMVIFVVCCMAKRRSSTDVYLTHLAVADLLFGLTLPFWAVDVHAGWIFGNAMCKLVSGLQEASEYAGVFLLACISVDRRFAIVKATRIRSPNGVAVKAACAAVWLVAVALSISTMVQRRHMYAEELDLSICYEDLVDESSDRWYVVMHILRHVLGFFLPLGVMAVCYGSTLVTLHHAQNRQKQKAMRVILAVVSAFIVCWLPHNVVVLIELLIRSGLVIPASCGTMYAMEVALKVTKVLAYMHCTVNPVLYAFIGVKFRDQLLTACRKRGFSRTLRATFKSSVSSAGSTRSRNTSV